MLPTRRVAEAAWDDASFALAILRHAHPRVCRALAFAAEVAQRPARRVRVGDGPVRLVYAGNDQQLYGTLARTLGITSSTSGGHIAWGSTRRLPDADVEAVEIGWWDARRARAAGSLVLPRWVGLAVDVDVERLDARRRSLLTRAETRGLTAEVVEASTAMDDFFERFYEPTARVRHGDEAHVARRRYMRHAARHAVLLFVREGTTRLAGILLARRTTDFIDAWITGVVDGDYARADAAVRVALYVFAMRHAKSRGAKTLGLTTAPPFLGDGLLRYKRSFGAYATTTPWCPIALELRVRRATPSVVAALSRSPPIHLAGGGLVGVTLTDSRQDRAPHFATVGVEGPVIVPGTAEALASWVRAE